MNSEYTIPHVIHYCWFGLKPKPKLVLDCILSWQKKCPDFIIKEWNESTYNVHSSPFSSRMYYQKKWAFVADYARLTILIKEGGIYLDTDMELVQDISPLLGTKLLLGEEEHGTISAGMIGSIPHHPFIQKCKERYDSILGLPPTIPRLMTEVFISVKDTLTGMTVCPPIAFYPYSQETIAKYKKEDLTKLTYGVHLWNYSWGHPVLRIANKFSFYYMFKKILGALGLKKILKKILSLS